jgi:hypothetical protein
MNEDNARPLPIEEALTALYAAPDPDAAFIAALERKLLAQVAARPDETTAAPVFKQPTAPPSFGDRLRREWLALWPRSRWATALFLLALVCSLTLVAVGPQRAWAALQQWLGYAPGIGFVDLAGTAVLPEPVAVAQTGVTARIEQVIARPDKTTVLFNSKGLPPEDALWPNILQDEGNYLFQLHLPDGQTVTATAMTLRFGSGTLEFPPLPDGVLAAELEMGRLPLVPPGMAPESWRIPFSLQPATPDLVAALYPYAYAPVGAADTQQGVTVRVLEAAHTPEETAVRLQAEWTDAEWKLFNFTGGSLLPTLTDETGRAYRYGRASSGGSRIQTVIRSIEEGPSTPSPERPSFDGTLHFQPVSPAARQLTLVLDSLEFQVPAQTAFSLDIGPNPQVGDSWPLDLHLDVAGFPVQISAARIIEERVDQRPFGEPLRRIALQFEFDPIPTVDGRTLWAFGLNGSAAGFSGSSGSFSPDDGRHKIAVTVGADEPLPTGLVTITIPHASVVYQGPWTLTWSTP